MPIHCGPGFIKISIIFQKFCFYTCRSTTLLFHIVQITDFVEFLHGNQEEKYKIFTNLTNLVLTRNIKIIRWCAVVAIKHTREFSIVKSGYEII